MKEKIQVEEYIFQQEQNNNLKTNQKWKQI